MSADSLAPLCILIAGLFARERGGTRRYVADEKNSSSMRGWVAAEPTACQAPLPRWTSGIAPAQARPCISRNRSLG